MNKMIEDMQSASIEQISSALAKFQDEMPTLIKTGRNFQKGNAADLGDIVTVARTGNKHGLSFSQPIVSIVKQDGQKSEYFVQTFVRHTSGEWISGGIMPILPEKTGMQNFGSALTYSKKYSLQSVLGIADYNEMDLDDEYNGETNYENATALGNGVGSGDGDASGPPKKASKPPSPPQTQQEEISIEEEILAASDVTELQVIWNRRGMSADSGAFSLFEKRVDELNGTKEN